MEQSVDQITINNVEYIRKDSADQSLNKTVSGFVYDNW